MTDVFLPCRHVTATLLLAVAPLSAHAQRVDDNAVTQAEDAFGINVGGEDNGLYAQDDVRGFSPVAAGNIRIEGMTVDRQAEFTSRLVEGNRIRVGLSAQGYAFPAPTGIVDFTIRKPAGDAILSATLTANANGAANAEFDGLLPLTDRLGVAAGVGVYHHDFGYGGHSKVLSTALSTHWRPTDAFELLPFTSRIAIDDQDAKPTIATDSPHLPPQVSPHRFIGQDWTQQERRRENHGVIASFAADGWSLRGGLFRSSEKVNGRFSDLLLATTPDGVARHKVIAAPHQRSASTSGDLRVDRSFDVGGLRHTVELMARGRRLTRHYGGATSFDFGETSIFDPAAVPAPEIGAAAMTRDRINQITGGIGYHLVWRDRGELMVGLQRSRYRKTVELPGRPTLRTADDPWLPTASAAIRLLDGVDLFASYAKGLEESPVAPDIAVNRDEAPPAIRTRQIDAGLSWRIAEGLRLVATAFQIDKPHFDLDEARIFRRLGDVRHRGVEASVTGELVPGLTLVAGAVLLDAEVAGEAVESGIAGRRPVAVPARTALVSLDYRPGGDSRWSVDARLLALSAQQADVLNRYEVPARAIVDAGIRYRFALGSAPAVIRLSATNLFDRRGYDVVGSGAFLPIDGRQVTLRLTADF